MSDNHSESADVRAFFDAYAAGFDSIYGHTSSRSAFGRWIDRTFRQSMYLRYRDTIKAIDNTDIKTVLDVGCGPGRYCLEFLRMGKTVVGIDLAGSMLQLARALCERELPAGEVEFIEADYTTYQFTDTHDAIVLMGFFDYIRDAAGALKKAQQSAPRLIVASFPKPAGVVTWFRKLRYRARGCPVHYYTRSDLKRLLHETGCLDHDIVEYDRDFFVTVRL